MNTWNGKSSIIRATIAETDGFVMNMDKKVRHGIHVKDCGNMRRSFIGPFRASTNLKNGVLGLALCCQVRGWDRLWPEIRVAEEFKQFLAKNPDIARHCDGVTAND